MEKTDNMQPSFDMTPYMKDDFINWCVEKRGKKLDKAKEYVRSLRKIAKTCWNESVLGWFSDVREAFETPTENFSEFIGYQIAARIQLENQLDVISWYASFADEAAVEAKTGVTDGKKVEETICSATFRKWHTALKEYCKFLEYTTCKALENGGFGGDKDGNVMPGDDDFVKMERDAKRAALRWWYSPFGSSGALTDERVDKVPIEPFVTIRQGNTDYSLEPKIYFPLAGEFKVWLKEIKAYKNSGMRYIYPSAINKIYNIMFVGSKEWNSLAEGRDRNVTADELEKLKDMLAKGLADVRKSLNSSKETISTLNCANSAIDCYVRFLYEHFNVIKNV